MVLNKFYFKEANGGSKENSSFSFRNVARNKFHFKKGKEKKQRPYESEGVGTEGINEFNQYFKTRACFDENGY